MFCEICRQKIIVRLHLMNIFRREVHHICEKCFRKYPLHVKESIIPIDGGEILWHSLLNTNDTLSPLAHMSFYQPFYTHFMRSLKKTYTIIFLERLTEDWVFRLEQLNWGKFYLVTHYDGIKNKEDVYDFRSIR